MNTQMQKSPIVALGHLIGESVKGLNVDTVVSADSPAANDEDLHYRRLNAAQDLITLLSPSDLEEAAILAVSVLGYINAMESVEIGGADAKFVRGGLAHAQAGLTGLTRFLARQSGVDLRAIGGDYFTTICDEEPAESSADVDLDAELKQHFAAWRQINDNPVTEDPADPRSDIAEGWSEAEMAATRAVCNAPAQTIDGLSLKLQAMAAALAERWNLEHYEALVATSLDAAEMLAPGTVIYQPKFQRD